MNRLTLALVLPAVIAVCAPAAAQPPAAPPPAAQTAAPEGLAYFVGAWRAEARDPRTGETIVVPYRVEPILDGAWLAGTADSSDPTIRARDVWGRDPMSGEGEAYEAVFLGPKR